MKLVTIKFMMMVLMMMLTMMIMTMMRMTLMEQRASKLADPQWGSVRRHFDHSITITPQNHNTYLCSMYTRTRIALL